MNNLINITEYEWQEHTFYIQPMNAFIAVEVLGDLQRLFLPALGAAIKEQNHEVLEKMTLEQILTKTELDLGKGIKTLSDALSGRLLRTHLETILSPEYISVKRPGEDEAVKLNKAMQIVVFTGQIKGMLTLAKKVLEINFADFFTTTDDASGNTKEDLENLLNCPASSEKT